MAEILAQSLDGSALSALYCGPGENVVRTAEIVGKALGIRPKRIDEFRNLDQGLWQGLQIDEIKRRNTKLFRQWIDDPETICPPQGETVEGAMERIKAASSRSGGGTRTNRSAWSWASRWPRMVALLSEMRAAGSSRRAVVLLSASSSFEIAPMLLRNGTA